MLKYPRILSLVGPRLLFDYTFYLWPYARHPEKAPLAKRYRVVHNLIRVVLDHFRIEWDMAGLDELKKLNASGQSFLLVSNHESAIDGLAIFYWSEKAVSVVAKKETLKMPFIAAAVKAVDGLFMNRDDLRQSFQVIKTVESRLASNYCSYLIFPEGTRNKQPETTPVAPFHPGTFKCAMSANVPILPLAIYGTFRPFKTKPDLKRNLLSFHFGKPLYPQDYAGKSTAEVAGLLTAWVNQEVETEKQSQKIYYDKGYEKVPLRKGPLFGK